MRPATGLILAATALLPPLLPAGAEERPPMTPTRDVAVTYRLEGPGTPPGEMRLSWLNAEQRMRMDLPGGVGWTLIDMKTGRAVMVMEQQRMAMDMPPEMTGGRAPLQPGPGARFSRGGQETLLGRPCTVWRVEEGASRGEACITPEGVMLRSNGSSGGQGGALAATAVDFAAQDPARFRVPADYRRMELPAGMMPGMVPPGAGRPPGR